MADLLEQAQLPAATESDTKFDSAASWDSDSSAHDPTEAGNDAVPEVAAPVHEPAVSDSSEPAISQKANESDVPEEPVRNEQGQFVKKPGKGKPRSDPQARVEAATAKEAAAKEDARQAREEAKALAARLAAYEARQAPVSPQPPTAAPPAQAATFPTFDAWMASHPGQDWDAYIRDLTAHQAESRAQAIVNERLAQWQGQQIAQQRQQTIAQRIAEAQTRLPDFEQVIAEGAPRVGEALARRGLQDFPPVMHEAVAESPQIADIRRYFGLHPEDAAQLAAETASLPVTAAPMVRRYLESLVTTAAAPAAPDSAPLARPSLAKPPINRVGGSASATPADPDDLDFGPEYIRLENERERKRSGMGRW